MYCSLISISDIWNYCLEEHLQINFNPVINSQKRVLWIITFSNYSDHSIPLFNAFEIIIFEDIIFLHNAIFKVPLRRNFSNSLFLHFLNLYHRFRWYATLENKTLAETFPKFPSVIRVIDRSDRNPPITDTSVTFWLSLRHASGLWLVDFDPICR